MKSNDLTLAICLYNAENYIAETLNCVLNQTLQNFDLLIVNDCSTDNSLCIVEEFFKQHPHQYELINIEINKGIASARQLALEQAKTKYILFIDSDDLPHKILVEKEYNLISSDENIIAVSCWLQFIDQYGNKLNGGLFIGPKTKDEFITQAGKAKLMFLPIQTLFNREIALQVGGFKTDGFPDDKPRYQDFCEDLDLWTRMSDLYKEGKYILSIPQILYSYRKSNSGLSSNAFYMILKMRYVKSNLLRRRSGEKELTFVEFYRSLSGKELYQLKQDSVVADSLRNGVFCLKKGRIFTGGYLILKSIIMKPEYLWQKIKSNSGIFK